jgi:hypothetical protein
MVKIFNPSFIILVQNETEELELLEITLGMENQVNDREISHIKEEDEENSSSCDEEEDNKSKLIFDSKTHENSQKAQIFKRQDSLPYPTKTKKDLDDTLTTKFDYSKVNVKRNDKKLDDALTAKYDFSRVAQKRPTMLEKQYNFSNNNLLNNKKEVDKKMFAEPKRDDKISTNMARRSILKTGGTVIASEKPLMFGKKDSNNNSGAPVDNNKTTVKTTSNKTQDSEPADLSISNHSLGESQVKRRADKRVSMVVNPVKRDSLAINNATNKSFVGKPEINKIETSAKEKEERAEKERLEGK